MKLIRTLTLVLALPACGCETVNWKVSYVDPKSGAELSFGGSVTPTRLPSTRGLAK